MIEIEMALASGVALILSVFHDASRGLVVIRRNERETAWSSFSARESVCNP